VIAQPLLACDAPFPRRLAWIAVASWALFAYIAWTAARLAGAGSPIPIAAAAGLILCLITLAFPISAHWRGHTAEARRLGFRLRRAGWRLALSDDATAEEKARWESEAVLVRIRGAWANARLMQFGFRLDFRFMTAVSISAALFVLLPRSTMRPEAARLGLALNCFVAFCAAAVFALQRAHMVIAESAGEELWHRPGHFPGGFRKWPFWSHVDQRQRQRRRGALQRDQRLILWSAGLRGDLSVIEVGCGASLVWGHVPKPRRKGWVHFDADLAALLDARSRGRGTRWVCADASRMPFSRASVDMIVGSGFFDAVSFEQSEKILEESARVARAGAVLVHMQDFKDYPGAELVEQFNALWRRAFDLAPFRFERYQIAYPSLSASDLSRASTVLHKTAKTLGPAWLDRAAFLLEALNGQAADAREPNAAFIGVFKRALARHGFETVSTGDELRARLTHTSYLIAKRKG
jgi:ubiquinone/menaquinone biosynthesis C-methylase UbiE